MKKTGWIVLSLAGLLTACNGDKQKAAGLLERANASFEAGDYNLAKLQIDSIRTFYPKNPADAAGGSGGTAEESGVSG